MTIHLEGLLPYNAIRIGGQLAVNLPSGNYKICEKEVPSYSSVVFLEEECLPIFRIKKGGLFVKRREREDGETISNEEFMERYSKITEGYREDDEFCFPDLETEYRVKKAIQDLELFGPIYDKHPDTFEEVDIVVVGEAADTGSKFITTALSVGKGSFVNANFYKVDVSGVVADEFKRFMIENQIEYVNPTHSNVRFVQVNGKYIMTNIVGGSEKVFSYCTSLSEAQKSEKEKRSEIKTHLSLLFHKGEPVSVGEIYSSLLEIKESVSKLRTTAKSTTSRNSALNKINTLLENMKHNA